VLELHFQLCLSPYLGLLLEFAQMWEEAVRVYAFLRRCVSFLGNRHLPLLAEGNTPLL
jgi:hypothetical protein